MSLSNHIKQSKIASSFEPTHTYQKTMLFITTYAIHVVFRLRHPSYLGFKTKTLFKMKSVFLWIELLANNFTNGPNREPL